MWCISHRNSAFSEYPSIHMRSSVEGLKKKKRRDRFIILNWIPRFLTFLISISVRRGRVFESDAVGRRSWSLDKLVQGSLFRLRDPRKVWRVSPILRGTELDALIATSLPWGGRGDCEREFFFFLRRVSRWVPRQVWRASDPLKRPTIRAVANICGTLLWSRCIRQAVSAPSNPFAF